MSDKWTKVGETPEGYNIWRVPNDLIGGYNYVSDSVGGGYVAVDSIVSISELEVILADMKMLEKRAQLEKHRDIRRKLDESSS